MNISSATTVCENWNSINNNPSMMSFLGFESNNQRQFCEWETNTHNPSTPITTTLYNNNNNYPFLNTPNTSFNCNNNTSSSSPTFVGHTTMSYPKLSDYSMAAEIIGLNLGGRTYFSSQESAVIDRLFKRPRGFYESNHAPRCQAEGCGIDLTLAKHYHRRHKVCEIHSKATKVVTGGLEQRFCQQCSRFHVLTEFDEGKRSCRKRLADHNRRRRKPPPPPKVSEKATSEVVSSSGTKSEMKEKSVSSSSSCGIPKNSTNNSSSPCTSDTNMNNNGFFLHAPYKMDREKERQPQHDMSYASATNHQRQEPMLNDLTTMSLFERGVFYSSSNATNLSMDCGGSDQIQHHQEDLQNLLHLGQALFEVDFSD